MFNNRNTPVTNEHSFDNKIAKTVADLLQKSIDDDQYKADFEGKASHFEFDANARLTVREDIGDLKGVTLSPLEMSDWAFAQMCSKLGKTVFGKGIGKGLPKDYLLALRPDLRAFVMNDHLHHHANGNWMVRAYKDTCRAVLSDIYTDISNTELLTMLDKIVKGTQQPSALTRSSEVHPDGMNVRIIWQNVTMPEDNGGNKNWGMGVYIGNGETGNNRLRLFPLIKRHSCDNSIMVDQGKGSLEFVHVGSSVTKMTLVKAAMQEVLPVAAHLLETMIEADAQKIPDFTDVINGLSKQYGWTDDTTKNVFAGTERGVSRAAIVNGITFAAQKLSNPDDQADMELLGGRILVAPDSIFGKAARLAQVEEAIIERGL